MKQSILISLSLLLYLSSFAQNEWLCVYPDKKTYFENFDKEVYCIRIDSTFNDNTILYPFSDLHNISSHGEWCYSVTSGSWLSKYIVLDDDGNTFFINGKEQPVFIKSQADLNETWDVFENDKIKVRGEITSIEEKDILGVKDWVKTISFSVYDLDDMPVEHALNETTIEVSKNLGLVRTISFYYFEHKTSDYPQSYYAQFSEFNLIGIDEPQLGFQNVNLKEQYFDFQIGDELHIRDFVNQFMSYYFEKKIKLRYLSRNDYEDSIEYSCERKIYSKINIGGLFNPDISTSIDTITETISKGLFFDTEPNEPYGDRRISTVRIVNRPIIKTTFFNYNLEDYEGCLTPIIDGYSMVRTYCLGLGGPYYSEPEMWGYQESNELVYYKKGDTEWGTPFDFEVSIPAPDYQKEISIYPNPASNYIFIKTADNAVFDNGIIEIYDIQGRKQLSKELDRSGSIDVSFLKTGCYLMKIMRGNENVIYLKFVKE